MVLRGLLVSVLLASAGCTHDWSAKEADGGLDSPTGEGEDEVVDEGSSLDGGEEQSEPAPSAADGSDAVTSSVDASDAATRSADASDAAPSRADASEPPDVATGPMLNLACTDGTLATSVVTRASTQSGGDNLSGTCGGASTPDLAYAWTAPEDDFYRFTTAGSSFDSVLYLRERDCAGNEVECNDNVGSSPTAAFIRRASKGSTWVVVADAKSGDTGSLELLVEPIACPRINLDTPILPVQHSTVGQPDSHTGSCGGQGAGDRAYRFTAPSTGMYRFEVQRRDAAFVPAVYVEDGPVCGGKVLQCNKSGDGLPQVARFLQQGQSVVVIVDGATSSSAGAFALDVARLQDACTDGALQSGKTYSLPKTGKHRMTTSCGGASVWWYGRTDPKEIRRFPDLSLTFTSPKKGDGTCPAPTCTIEIDAGFPFFASITDGNQCAGAEVSCKASAAGAMAGRYTANLTMPKTDGAPYTLTIDRELMDVQSSAVFVDLSTDDIKLNVRCVAIC